MKINLQGFVTTVSLAACLLGQPSHAQESATTEGSAAATSELQKVVDSGKLRVGVNPGFMPFSFVDESGKRVGVDIDIAGQLAEALGVELEVTAPEDFSGLLPMLIDDEVDLVIAGMSITFERAKEVNFTDPYFDTGMSLLMNIGTSARLGIANAKESGALFEALRKRGSESRLRIAVTEGKAPAGEAERRFPEARITGYPSNEEAAMATLEGEADLMLHDEIFLKVWFRENATRARLRTIVLDPPIKPDFYGIAARKGDPDWLRLLDVFVRELRANDQVIHYLGEYLPSMDAARMTDKDAPVFDLGDME